MDEPDTSSENINLGADGKDSSLARSGQYLTSVNYNNSLHPDLRWVCFPPWFFKHDIWSGSTFCAIVMQTIPAFARRMPTQKKVYSLYLIYVSQSACIIIASLTFLRFNSIL